MNTSDSAFSSPEITPDPISASRINAPNGSTALAVIPERFGASEQPVDGASSSGGLFALWNAFRRCWPLALSISLLCGGTAAVLEWIFWKPEYVAASYLRVASQQPMVMMNSKDMAGQTSYDLYKRTQKELIRNRFVLNAALRDPKVAQLPIVKQQLNPVDWLQDQITVSYPGDAEILEISMRGELPEVVAVLVNAVCDSYVEGVVHAERNDRLKRLQNLEKIHNETEEKLRQKRGELNVLVESLGTGSTQTATQKQQIALDSYGAMRKEQLGTQISLMHTLARVKAEQSRLDNISQEPVAADAVEAMIIANPEYHGAAQNVEARQQILDTTKTRANDATEALAGFFSKHQSEVQKAKEKLEEIRAKIKPTIEAELRRQMGAQAKSDLAKTKLEVETLKEQYDQVGKEVDKYGKESHQIGRSSVDLEMMKADIENVEKINKEMASEIETLRVELASASRVEVISRADVPRMVDEKAHMRQAGTYGGVLFCIPLIGICWWDARRKKLNTADEVTGLMRLHLLGSLPLLPNRVHRGLGNGAPRTNWHRMLGEAIDSIREMLMSEARNRPAKVVIITSAMGGEGKTTVATQLAMSFARANKRTVVVDFDLRRPATHVALGKPSDLGIAELLRGTNTIDEMVYPTAWPNLFHLPVGQIDQESPKLLCGYKELVEGIFTHLRQQFEIVIVDSCPVLPVVDTLIIGQYADIALLSMMRDVSRSHQVLEAQERLKHIGIKVLGAVVTTKGRGVYSSHYYSQIIQKP